MKSISTRTLTIIIAIALAHCLPKKETPITRELIEFSGRYVGILPCADCEGIKYDLTLSADGTYGEDSKYLGKSDELFHHAGDWKLVNDSTLELKTETDIKYFLSRHNNLVLLDKNRELIESSFAGMYELKRVEDDFERITRQAMSMGRMGRMAMSMEDMETDFSGHGNEPYWNLKIDFEGDMTFKTMEGMETYFSELNIDEAQDGNILRVEGSDGMARLVVKISETDCSDGMSDKIFRNKVEVSLIENKATANYLGCGNYLADYHLHDIWALSEINGKSIKRDGTEDEKIPTFEFYSREERMMGNMGCNDFNGSFYVCGKGLIQFGEFAVTSMECADMSTDQILSKALSGKRVMYEIKNLQLMITTYDGIDLTFRKVD